MSDEFEAARLALLKAAAQNYEEVASGKNEAPIGAARLETTTKTGWGSVIAVFVAAIGAIITATEHLAPAITVGAMGFAAIVTLSLALVIQSDQSARAAVTVAMAQMAPSLILSSQPMSPEPLSAVAGPTTASGTNFVAISPTLKATLKNEDDDADLFALRFDTNGDSTSITYLVGHSGHSDLQWKSEAEVSMITK